MLTYRDILESLVDKNGEVWALSSNTAVNTVFT